MKRETETTLGEATRLCMRIVWLSLKLGNAKVTNFRLWLSLAMERMLP